VKDIFTEKKRRREILEVLKSGFDNFLRRSTQTTVVNIHTVTYKSIAPADNSAQLEFNCSGHSEYYIDLNSVRLSLRIKLVNTNGSDLSTAVQTKLVVSITCCIPCLALSVSR
jgi:hypothetical protein